MFALNERKLDMSLSVKQASTADEVIDVDIAKYAQDKDYFYVEYAKIISEDKENTEIEVRSRLKFPVEYALDSLMKLLEILMIHENEHKSGHGIVMSEDDDIVGEDGCK
jgi:hypothetical protein